MHRLLALLALLGALSPALAYHEANEPSDGTVRSFRPVEPPVALGGVRFFDGDGAIVGFDDLRGRLLLINIWATWCGPCRREMPALDRLQQRLGGDRFRVVAISIDDGGLGVVRPFLEGIGVGRLEPYTDPYRSLRQVLPIDVVPASFFVDRDGRVVSFLRSYVDWDDPLADTYINRLIAGESPAHGH